MKLKNYFLGLLLLCPISSTLYAQCTDCAFPTQVINGVFDPVANLDRIDGRLFRDSIPSDCSADKVCPGVFSSGTPMMAVVHSFTNESEVEECITVEFDPDTCSTNAHANAYIGNFVINPTPADANEAICGSEALGYTFVGDVGASLAQRFQFNVPASSDFSVVVTTTSAVSACNYDFTIGSCAGAKVGVNPSLIDFGTVIAGVTPANVPVGVVSCGTTNLTVGSIAIGGDNPTRFSVISDLVPTGELAPNKISNFQIGFVPDGADNSSLSAKLIVQSDDPVTPEASVNIAITANQPADLQVTAMKARAVKNGKFFCRFNVVNNGAGPAAASTITVRKSKKKAPAAGKGKIIGTFNTPALGAGETSELFRVKTKHGKSKFCVVDLDTGLSVVETDEVNNRLAKKIKNLPE